MTTADLALTSLASADLALATESQRWLLEVSAGD